MKKYITLFIALLACWSAPIQAQGQTPLWGQAQAHPLAQPLAQPQAQPQKQAHNQSQFQPQYQPQYQGQYQRVETFVEEWNPATQQWVRVKNAANRFLPSRVGAQEKAIAHYGPFQVMDAKRATLNGPTTSLSPQAFARMLRDYPQLEVLQMIECPGTEHDTSNFIIGRMIREAGLTTHVPAGGSVRSGAVELFLAGAQRQIDEGAEFAVHSWMDENGRQPQDFAANAPQNRNYLNYYMEMGMDARTANAFYDMTNSVAFNSVKWLNAQDMRRWVGGARPSVNTSALQTGLASSSNKAGSAEKAPQLTYLSVS